MSIRAVLIFSVLSSLFAPMIKDARADEDRRQIQYYVQLVRGNDSAKPPSPEAKPIGPKLSKQFRVLFKFQNYWEMRRVQVKLGSGEKAKVRLTKEREVEIDLTQAGKRRVTAFWEGKSHGTVSGPIGDRMTITGGDRDTGSAWFIVVRRDPPPD